MKLNDKKLLIPLLLLFNIFFAVLILFVYSQTAKLNPSKWQSAGDKYSIPTLPRELSDKITVASRAYIIYDSLSRTILLGKNEKLRFAPASTVKIMTAIIALEYFDKNQVLYAQGLDAVEGSKMKLVDGEQITVANLLYGLMLPSGNDAAYVFAQNFPGGTFAFVKKMNEKAVKLGLSNTKFVDPAGYDDNNYTTAFDLARLGAYAIENPDLRKVVSTRSITVSDISGQNIHDLYNLNELLGIPGITGIKTGFTDEAGGVLVTSFLQDSRTYIIVVLNSVDRFGDTKSVIDEAFEKIKILPY